MTKRTPFLPAPGERALVVGQTGSGKTSFTIWLLERLATAPIVIYDTKDEPKFLQLPKHRVVETMEQALTAYNDILIDYIIVRPPVEILGRAEQLDAMLFYHYTHFHDSVAYIDEVSQFHNGNYSYKGLAALLARGRSRNITSIFATQRPKGISMHLMTETQKFYIFKLQDRKDRKRFDDVIPDFSLLPVAKPHHFYFYESGDDTVENFAPVTIDGKFDTGYIDTTDEVSGPDTGLPHIWL